MQPATEVMQGHLRRHAYLQPPEVVGPFTIEAERLPALLLHGLHDRTPARPRRSRLGHGTRLWRFGGQMTWAP